VFKESNLNREVYSFKAIISYIIGDNDLVIYVLIRKTTFEELIRR